MAANRIFNSDSQAQQADPTEQHPWVNVHVISEATFCPRAGLIAYELGKADDGEDGDVANLPRLDYLPDYDEELIKEALSEKWSEVRRAAQWVFWYALAVAAVLFGYERTLGLFLSAPIITSLWWFGNQAVTIAKLQLRRNAAVQPRERLTIAQLIQRGECEVNWWQLRAAGFSLLIPNDSLREHGLNVSGRPFATLQFQSYRIPVVRKHRGKHELRSQQRVRIAAYCRLIETAEGAQSPFGVLLFADSYDVFIVPNSPHNQQTFAESLRQTRELIASAMNGDLPSAPDDRCCAQCPIGRPKVFRRGKTDAHLSVLPGAFTPRNGNDGQVYHSVCGDRFERIPPHEKAHEKGLLVE